MTFPEPKNGLRMTSAELPCYTLLNMPADIEIPSEQQLKMDLEKGDDRSKADALKKILFLMANGEKFPGILMHIIRFVLPSRVTDYLMNS